MKIFWATALWALFLSGCGISKYPGQAGIVTNGFSKLDLEQVDLQGLWVYEATYDNRPEGKGVSALVTRLYPGAKTFTSNVRSNADGTHFKNKGPASNGVIQAVTLPQIQRIIFPEDSRIQVLVDYFSSIDEIDDQNLAEYSLFEPEPAPVPTNSLKWKWELLKASRWENKQLAFEVEKIQIGTHTFVPPDEFKVATNIQLNGLQMYYGKTAINSFLEFFNQKFPAGYVGKIDFHLKKVSKPLSMKLGIHTRTSLEKSGWTIIHNVSQSEAENILEKIRKPSPNFKGSAS